MDTSADSSSSRSLSMRSRPSVVLCWLLLAFSALPVSAGTGEELVDVGQLDPTIVLDLRYATPYNFLKEAVYDSPRCLLRKSVAERLIRVQRAVSEKGFSLKIWDAYRPASVQKKMWKIVPDERYVASPLKGSKHSRGAAVDLTLLDPTGKELEMGTAFDDFSTKAFPESPEVSVTAKRNRRLLRDSMAREGFTRLSTEWWHFEAPGAVQYPLLDVPLAPR
jgi:zinc D-Ala-D-Ala dipeptidase